MRALLRAWSAMVSSSYSSTLTSRESMLPVPAVLAGRMEDDSAGSRMRMEPMDSIKGAQELALLLEERHGVTPEAVPRPPLADAAAAPIFHWVGIEPPLAALE